VVPAVRRTLAWLRRWGVSFGSLAGGVATLFVFRRGLPHVGWIVGYLLLLWLLFAVLTEARQMLEASGRRGRRLVVFAADYTIQTLYHGLLLFVLPAYWAGTTLTSVNAPFLGLLVALALLATFDPWYRALVHPRPWVGWVFFVVSIFAALNVALPLVGLPPFPSLVASAFLAALALTPVIRRRRATWRAALRTAAAIGVVAATVAALGRAAIPPAPLFMARAQLGWLVGSLDSLEPPADGIPVVELRRRGLVAHTAIYAPAGLRQPVSHVWRRGGAVITVVPLSPVRGGRREGFRTRSQKTTFPADPTGRWTVDVVTSSGQLIGRLRFRVVS
jgi:hypothetical protein